MRGYNREKHLISSQTSRPFEFSNNACHLTKNNAILDRREGRTPLLPLLSVTPLKRGVAEIRVPANSPSVKSVHPENRHPQNRLELLPSTVLGKRSIQPPIYLAKEKT